MLLGLLLTINAGAQQVTLNGSMKDGDNGEDLIGGTVAVPSLGLGTSSNAYGFYSLTVPTGDTLEVVFSYVGFQSQTFSLFPTKDTTININLTSGVQLDEGVV